MSRIIHLSCCLLFGVLISLVALPGCTTPPSGAKDKEKDKEKDKGAKHDHDEVGPHGGPLADWDDKFHAEFTIDTAKKQAVVYILDDKAKLAPKIDAAKITKVKLAITSVQPPLLLDLKHDAALSSDKGIAFVVTHDQFGKQVEMKGVIDGTVDGSPYSNKFTYKPTDKAKGAYLRELYLKPGGIYTEADIKANGTKTAAEKFAGKIWDHADKKPGDKVCPITNNRAEKECAWTVNGQAYEFCCHPCVDKFIQQAHNEPGKIKPAKDYVFKGS